MEPLKLKITTRLANDLEKQCSELLRLVALGRLQTPLANVMAFEADLKAMRRLTGYNYLHITNKESLGICSNALDRVIFLVSGQPGARALLVNHASSILVDVNLALENETVS